MEEKKQFSAEVGKVLQLMIHSLYTNKEIFMRELISNASDACDKLRYLSQTNSTLIGSDAELKITVKIDKDKKLVIIRDNGIGMNKEDLMQNLGTIAKSGTQNFLEQLSGDQKKDNMLIGQFGVGFYSSFMVADTVTVKSRKAGEDKAYTWSSDGNGEYVLGDLDEEFSRGTEITLHIKANEDNYLDHFRLKHIVKNYSDHIAIPICFIDESGNETKLNSSSALWIRSKSEVTSEQYNEFYKSVAYAADEPWLTMHNRNEGAVEFTNLLFIPSSKTFDLFHPDRKRRVKLYIKRVFISDENIDLIPHYLRFLRGVVDSEDLPLNISRETLQHNATLAKIKTSLTNRVISELKKKKEESFEEYNKFWQNFGSVLKEGLCEASNEHEKLLEICVFKSSLHNKTVSLDDYIANCSEKQKNIYYLSGDNPEKLLSSPHIEGFIKNNIDVLLFSDPVDDFWVNVNGVYKGYEIKSITRSDIDLENIEKDSTESTDKQDPEKNKPQDDVTYSALIAYFKTVLGESVKDVKISKKLVNSPVCLTVGEGAMDMRMERFLIEQKQLHKVSAKILEINPKHPIIAKISDSLSLQNNTELEKQNSELVKLLFDQACILDGETIIDPNDFADRINSIIQKIL